MSTTVWVLVMMFFREAVVIDNIATQSECERLKQQISSTMYLDNRPFRANCFSAIKAKP